jgi:hypothetical protein
VINEFYRAYQAIRGMIGAAYEMIETKQKLDDIPQNMMITILGSIISVSKSVLDQRWFIEKRYYDIVNDRVKIEDNPPTPQKSAESQKRKHTPNKSDVEIDYFYTDDSEDESTQEDHEENQTLESETESDVDVTSYYKINPNNAKLRETDGLDYSAKNPRKKVKRG